MVSSASIGPSGGPPVRGTSAATVAGAPAMTTPETMYRITCASPGDTAEVHRGCATPKTIDPMDNGLLSDPALATLRYSRCQPIMADADDG
jgi:hypothetical protein